MKQIEYKMKISDIYTLYKSDKLSFFIKGTEDSTIGSNTPWSNKQKSLFIHSILSGYLINPVCVVKKKNTMFNNFYIIDGKQRISTICNFIGNKFELNEFIPDIDNISLKNKLFCNLPLKMQKEFLNYNITLYIEEENLKENLESYIRYNGGTNLNPIEIFRAKLGININLLDDIVSHKVFMLFNLSRKNPFNYYEMGLYILMLESNPNTGLAKKEKESFIEQLSTIKKIDDDILYRIKKHLDYFYSAFYNKKYLSIVNNKDKYLKKSHIIIIYQLINIAIKKEITPEEFFKWCHSFFYTKKTPHNIYWIESSRGSTTAKSSMDIRYNELVSRFNKYFEKTTVIPFKLKGTQTQ